METLVASDRFQRFYNCSFYEYESVPRMARKNMLVGIILLMLYAVFEILYVPCLAVFARRENIRESCYKLMLFMGILSMINIHSSGLIIGVYAIRGDVFCDRPLFNYVIGMPAFGLYCAESLTAVILAFNRCIEMWDNRIVRILFDGHRMYWWMAGVVLYGFVLGTFTIPPIPNGMLVGWFWNPHIAYFDDTEGVYQNKAFTAHNISIGFGLPLIYAVFYIIMHKKMSMIGAEGVQNRQRAAERRKSKANIFVQVLLIGILHMFCTLLYVYIQYFPVPSWVIMSASYAWIVSQGFIPVIYITFNKYIRRSIKRFFIDPTLSQLNTMRIYTTQVPSINNIGESRI
uniref:Uncharacterized protein n=1 Tax=Globodera rostochiensis TaxID=31243 RepID=A0A914HVF2_GLORO